MLVRCDDTSQQHFLTFHYWLEGGEKCNWIFLFTGLLQYPSGVTSDTLNIKPWNAIAPSYRSTSECSVLDTGQKEDTYIPKKVKSSFEPCKKMERSIGLWWHINPSLISSCVTWSVPWFWVSLTFEEAAAWSVPAARSGHVLSQGWCWGSIRLCCPPCLLVLLMAGWSCVPMSHSTWGRQGRGHWTSPSFVLGKEQSWTQRSHLFNTDVDNCACWQPPQKQNTCAWIANPLFQLLTSSQLVDVCINSCYSKWQLWSIFVKYTSRALYLTNCELMAVECEIPVLKLLLSFALFSMTSLLLTGLLPAPTTAASSIALCCSALLPCLSPQI